MIDQNWNTLFDITQFSVAAMDVFVGSSGLQGADIGGLISGTVMAIVWLFAAWVVVGTIARWMSDNMTMLAALLILGRTAVVVVAVTSILSISMN